MIFYISPLTIILALLLVLFIIFINYESSPKALTCQEGLGVLPEAPGPKAFPIIGSLHVMNGYEVPYQAFSALAEKYGDIIKLKLGSVKSLVVNGQENIREVLMTKGHHFDSRPNFERYHMLFCGDKENCEYIFLINFYMIDITVSDICQTNDNYLSWAKFWYQLW